MEKPEKVQSSAGYNSGEQYYRADEMDAYLADRDDDLRDEVAKAVLSSIAGKYDDSGWTLANYVESSFEYADAFLAESERHREGR